MITSYSFGHKIYWVEKERIWKYIDNDEVCPFGTNNKRSCPDCNKFPTKEGHDPCLGTLPGVKNACCGHGSKNPGYIHFENGLTIYFNTIKIIKGE